MCWIEGKAKSCLFNRWRYIHCTFSDCKSVCQMHKFLTWQKCDFQWIISHKQLANHVVKSHHCFQFLFLILVSISMFFSMMNEELRINTNLFVVVTFHFAGFWITLLLPVLSFCCELIDFWWFCQKQTSFISNRHDTIQINNISDFRHCTDECVVY